MPSPHRPLPTAAELDILAVLWRLGPATVREVHEELGKDNGYTTTLKQMQLMTEKGLLTRSERFRSHVYQASVPKEETQPTPANDLVAQEVIEDLRRLRVRLRPASRVEKLEPQSFAML